MEQALYRKYRPKSFDDAVGQDHITKTLQKAIKAGRISHAYLFTGPRGVGKTSIARILAHEVNDLPYKDESIHLDIIEIDAASNRRIDEIRDLRDKVRISPASSKYKVYIIDEVHMLTREAFNALLKTLEEPPAHCIFILATTEAHKLPETIISRTQRFEFKPVNAAIMSEHLNQIAKKEKIDIDKKALELLAEFGQGSFRDSIGYLDQLSSIGKKVTEDDVRELLGLPSSLSTSNILTAVRNGDIKSVAGLLGEAAGTGAGSAEMAASISKELRRFAADGQATPADIKLLKELSEIKASARPQELLEITLLQAAAAATSTKINHSPTDENIEDHNKNSGESVTLDTEPSSSPATDSTPAVSSSFSLDEWDKVLDMAKQRAASIYTALRLAHPSLGQGELVLAFEFPLHQKKLEQAKNKALVADIIEQLCGSKIAVKCVVDKTVGANKESSDETHGDTIRSITNIFGTAEMIET